LAEIRTDLTRLTLGVFFIVALAAASVWILYPFLPAVIWAATLVIATWPILCRVQGWLWNSRGLAVAVMTLTLLVVFVVPVWLAISTIVQNSDRIVGWVQSITSMELPPLPAWLSALPLIGEPAARFWTEVANSGITDILRRVTPYAGTITQWFISTLGGFGIILVHFVLIIAFSAILYARGEHFAAAALRFGTRLAGARGEQSVRLAGKAIRSVALGVVVTAFIQTTIGGLGIVIAGVPFASILCAIMFMLCIAQVGPALVLIPTVIWMFATQTLAPSIILLVCSLVAVSIDNIVRPILIRKGADLPLLLILAGVIGGLLAFGLIGIVLGPTILAIGYTLLGAWMSEPVDTGEGTAVGSKSVDL
jgi:predicted PurR-regulated permease PerM